MKTIALKDLQTTDGFLFEKQKMINDVTLISVYNRFKDTRFKAISRKNYRNVFNLPHIFWDSDLAKWLEAYAYNCHLFKNEELDKIANDTIDGIIASQAACGYFNSHFQRLPSFMRFTNRDKHELYCAGHLMEAAVALKIYRGDDRLLKAMDKYADYIIKRFTVKKNTSFITPGHPEIELALVKMHALTGDKKYLDLCTFFLDNRGYKKEKDVWYPVYAQSHAPVREQLTAEGHAVRALYLYTAMADIALINKDEGLLKAVKSLFNDISTKKMYITAGVGSRFCGESFSYPYHLPNDIAYAETCASIALAMFCQRLSLLEADSTYQDVLERAFYNGCLSGISRSGKGFYYVNPLELDVKDAEYTKKENLKRDTPDIERQEVFSCSCCPPNIARLIADFNEYAFTYDDDTLFVNQYLSQKTLKAFNGISVDMTSGFPYDGKVTIKISGNGKLALRIPAWAENAKIDLNGQNVKIETVKGYLFINVKDGDVINCDFPMKVVKVYANKKVHSDAGKIALCYGPLVLAAQSEEAQALEFASVGDINEAVVNVSDGKLQIKVPVTEYENDDLYFTKPKEKTTFLTFVPYFDWGNEWQKTNMRVWF